MNNDLAIVLAIFDGYEDMWDDCIRFIEEFWDDHPPIYIFSNELVKDYPNVKFYPVGHDAEWSLKIQTAIQEVKEQYMLLLLEDFYIGDTVDIDEFNKLMNFIRDRKIDYAKICDSNVILRRKNPKFDSNFPYETIYQDEPYGISLQAAVWEKTYLSNLVGNGNYNAWLFEYERNDEAKLAPHIPHINAVFDARNILHIQHGAVQGRMLPETVRYYKKKGIVLQNKRETMSQWESFNRYAKQIGRAIIPRVATNLTKNIARKLGFTFVEDKWGKR